MIVKRWFTGSCAVCWAANVRWWQLLDSCRVLKRVLLQQNITSNLLQRTEPLITSSTPHCIMIEKFLKGLSGTRILRQIVWLLVNAKSQQIGVLDRYLTEAALEAVFVFLLQKSKVNMTSFDVQTQVVWLISLLTNHSLITSWL